jgi:hypothetical protein
VMTIRTREWFVMNVQVLINAQPFIYRSEKGLGL